MSFTLVTLTRDYDLATSAAPEGHVTFAPDRPMHNGGKVGGVAGARVIALEVNDVQVNEAAAAGTTLGVGKTTSLRLSVGDVVRLMVWVDGGANVDLETSSPWNCGLALIRLGA